MICATAECCTPARFSCPDSTVIDSGGWLPYVGQESLLVSNVPLMIISTLAVTAAVVDADIAVILLTMGLTIDFVSGDVIVVPRPVAFRCLCAN